MKNKWINRVATTKESEYQQHKTSSGLITFLVLKNPRKLKNYS